MKYCKKCVYPIVAVNIEIEDDGICSSCKAFWEFNKMSDNDWIYRKKKFEKILQDLKSDNSNYDCLIPVSGGKDSYFQTHVIVKEYNLKPLLVTYNGGNYLPEGDFNRDQMRKVFNADHIVWSPSTEILKKLNLIGFEKMGDMNWHNHCGILTSPIIIASKFRIPLVIWGESPWDISGMFKPNDFPEFSARSRHEHACRGYEWYDFLNEKNYKINEKDMMWAKYPTDEEIISSNLKGIYIGTYFKWDPIKQVSLIKDLYGWREAEKPFQRTYRKFSNLDDRYESGIHDLMKFIKFGYGRGSDHASKDIRNNYMTREEGIKIVKKYDHVVSDDLYYWLEYVGKDEDYFWQIADTFRDPRVWRIEKNNWVKDNIWGEPSSYGKVRLSSTKIENFNLKKKKLKKNNLIN
jgi:N-acetyl sugar amidotransferase